MPEGPEVRRIADGLLELEGRRILHARVVSGRYQRGPIHDLDKLNGALVKRVIAKGKLLALHLDQGGTALAVLSTMGMSGWWFTLREELPPDLTRHLRIQLHLEGGLTAAFVDARNFGTFKVVSYTELKRKLGELGPDILTEAHLWAAIALPELHQRVKRFGGDLTVAEGLLDQRITAGCGNYIRADALYLARLSPHRQLSGLSLEMLNRLWTSLSTVGRHAYRDQHVLRQGAFDTLVYGKTRSPTDRPVASFTDRNDRTVWWSPEEQT